MQILSWYDINLSFADCTEKERVSRSFENGKTWSLLHLKTSFDKKFKT